MVNNNSNRLSFFKRGKRKYTGYNKEPMNKFKFYKTVDRVDYVVILIGYISKGFIHGVTLNESSLCSEYIRDTEWICNAFYEITIEELAEYVSSETYETLISL